MSGITSTAVRGLLALAAIAAIGVGCGTPVGSTTGSSTGIPASASPVESVSGSESPATSTDPSLPPEPQVGDIEGVPPGEGVLNAVWVGADSVVAGGFAGPSFHATILIFGGDGWTVATTPDAPGQVTGIARLGDRWIAVGNGLPDIRDGFIWDSTDGRTWNVVQTIEDAALYDLVVGDGVVVAAGALLDDEMHATAAAWSSTDGTTWLPADVEAADGTSIAPLTTTPDGFAATGDRPLGQPRPFWSATTAGSWSAQDNDLGDQLLPVDLVPWNDGLALVGASGRSGDQHPFVALSDDGRRWEQTNLSTDEGYASAVAVANERLVVAGVDADRSTLWTLRDDAWDAETLEGEGASIMALTWDAERGLIAVGSRVGQHAVWSLGE
jgi:hypothetical protein